MDDRARCALARSRRPISRYCRWAWTVVQAHRNRMEPRQDRHVRGGVWGQPRQHWQQLHLARHADTSGVMQAMTTSATTGTASSSQKFRRPSHGTGTCTASAAGEAGVDNVRPAMWIEPSSDTPPHWTPSSRCEAGSWMGKSHTSRCRLVAGATQAAQAKPRRKRP